MKAKHYVSELPSPTTTTPNNGPLEIHPLHATPVRYQHFPVSMLLHNHELQ